MPPNFRSLVHVAVLSLVAVASCRRPQANSRPVPAAPATARSAAAQRAERVSPANVIAIILAANNSDLSYARLAPARSSNAEVKAFAQRMLTDHTLLNARLNDIVMRGRLRVEDNASSLDFRDYSAARRDVLRDLDGARFDSAYVANEVQYHQQYLDAITDVLMPSTTSGELRDFVTSLRPAVSAHLAHAEQIRATLASRK